MSKPAHKSGTAAQLHFDRHPYLKHSTAEPQGSGSSYRNSKQEHIGPVTIADIVARIEKAEKPKLTFSEWKNHRFTADFMPKYMLADGTYLHEALEECWNAAQENK